MIVVDCLDDSDETLKRKTLDLLYKMTTPGNVVFIAGKLMDSLEGSNDPFLREELVSRITELAERCCCNCCCHHHCAVQLTSRCFTGSPQTTDGSSRP